MDAEHEVREPFVFSGYNLLKTNVKRDLDGDLCIPIIDEGKFMAARPIAQGTATYSSGRISRILLVKLSMPTREKVAREVLGADFVIVDEYGRRHRRFPQESTVDQDFERSQFRAYRARGNGIGSRLVREFLGHA